MISSRVKPQENLDKSYALINFSFENLKNFEEKVKKISFAVENFDKSSRESKSKAEQNYDFDFDAYKEAYCDVLKKLEDKIDAMCFIASNLAVKKCDVIYSIGLEKRYVDTMAGLIVEFIKNVENDMQAFALNQPKSVKYANDFLKFFRTKLGHAENRLLIYEDLLYNSSEFVA